MGVKMRVMAVGVVSLVLFVSAFLVVGCRASEPESVPLSDLPALHLQTPPAAPLTVWYLGHSGFAIRSGGRLLVFDYQEEYGTPSATAAAGGLEDGVIEAADLDGLDVYVFVTHSHEDHYDPVILDWADQVEGIEYFFGWEAGENADHHYLVGPQATYQVDGMEIYTINSHHSGVAEVAYLIHVDGRWIYHNGDYLQNYIPDFEYLATVTDHLDAVFHAGTTNDEWQYTLQGWYLLGHFSPDFFFPMHYGNDEGGGEGAEFARDVAARGYSSEVIVPRRRGDRWELGSPGGDGE
jgi:L-ascorbate metabolism protein UlaG (beta-lactamase superfamily)